MKIFKLCFAALLVSTASVCCAQNADSAPQSSTQNPEDGWFRRNVDAAEDKVESLYDNGRLSMVLSGYAYHDRRTYNTAHLEKINEKAWGIGMDKEMRDAKDNEESIQFLVIADSHNEPQISASYNYYWMKPVTAGWEAGAGYSAGLVSRTDIFKGIPIPAILPTFSVGTRDVKLLTTFVPHLSGTVNGNVLFFALRFNLK